MMIMISLLDFDSTMTLILIFIMIMMMILTMIVVMVMMPIVIPRGIQRPRSCKARALRRLIWGRSIR